MSDPLLDGLKACARSASAMAALRHQTSTKGEATMNDTDLLLDALIKAARAYVDGRPETVGEVRISIRDAQGRLSKTVCMGEQVNARERWLAGRKEAGQRIDPETCDIDWPRINLADPYGKNPESDESCIGKYCFVRSRENDDGWVCIDDLSKEQAEAIHKRIDRKLAQSDDTVTDDIEF